MTRSFLSTLDTMRTMSTTARLTTLALATAMAALLAPRAVMAQERMTVAPQEQPVVLRGATIHTVTKGTITNGTIVLERGKITAIGGADVAVPRGAKVVDVSGKHIYPGLIDAYSTVGITEIGSVDMSNDINELGDFSCGFRQAI